jgi:uncharacterized protein YebE (UPF0316 family)
MVETILGGLFIMILRILDVSIGTVRTIMVVQGRKYFAGFFGAIEVFIWLIAIRNIFQHLDQIPNMIGYSVGFGLGNIVGITIEQKIGLGYIQLNIISKLHHQQIAKMLRDMKFGVTEIRGEGTSGEVIILVVIIPRKLQSKIIKAVEMIDESSFITVQHSLPYRGFIHGSRK